MSYFLFGLFLGTAFAINKLVNYLLLRYKRGRVFISWTIASVVLWGVAFVLHSIFEGTETTNSYELDIFQYIIIFDLIVYFFFVISLAGSLIRKRIK